MGLERLQDKIHFPLGDSPWQQVVETFPDIAYIMSPDGVIVEANPRMCNMLQLPREKLLGSNIADYLTVEQGETVKRTLKEICRQRLPERSTQSYKLTTNDIRIYEVIESPLIEGGQVQAISGIGREITQEAALEHKLWDLADNRRGAVDFTLRTSLGLVKGYVYTLRRYGDLNEEQRTRYIQIIEEEIDSLSRTVENILDMRRLENAEFEIERDIIDLGECMRLAIRQCESDASRRSVEISADIPDHLDPMYIPKDAVCRVLTNLIQNSVETYPSQ